jgi:hypothetical protein
MVRKNFESLINYLRLLPPERYNQGEWDTCIAGHECARIGKMPTSQLTAYKIASESLGIDEFHPIFCYGWWWHYKNEFKMAETPKEKLAVAIKELEWRLCGGISG